MTDENDKNEDQIEELNEQEDSSSDFTGEFDALDLDAKPSRLESIKDSFTNNLYKIKTSISIIFNKKKTFTLAKVKADTSDEPTRNVKITIIDKLQYKVKQLELGRIVQNIYDPSSRSQINHITILILTVGSVYFSGKLLALILKGKENAKLTKVASAQLSASSINASEINNIKNNNIFKTSSGEVSTPILTDQKRFNPEKCEKASRPSSLPVKLVNTVVLQDSVKSVASVQVRGKLESFREGESIPTMAKIDKITRLELIIKNLKSGECELIRNNNVPEITSPKISVMSPSQSNRFKQQQKKVKGITNNGNNFKIKKSLINEQLKDLSALLTQARAIKIENPDGTLSFKLVEIEPGSIFSTLGVQNEDIITHIGGEPIRSMNEIMSLFGRLRSMSNLNLKVNRMGSDTDLKYSFE